jgi:hypothetical protein
MKRDDTVSQRKLNSYCSILGQRAYWIRHFQFERMWTGAKQSITMSWILNWNINDPSIRPTKSPAHSTGINSHIIHTLSHRHCHRDIHTLYGHKYLLIDNILFWSSTRHFVLETAGKTQSEFTKGCVQLLKHLCSHFRFILEHFVFIHVEYSLCSYSFGIYLSVKSALSDKRSHCR